MFFKTIKIKNLFSYKDVEFNLKKPSASNKNIVLIFGRNGFGKTSFLNSIKLLFHGPNDELLNEALPGRKLSIKSFTQGNLPDWYGILNQEARTSEEYKCYISIDWEDDDGNSVTASRVWRLDVDSGADLNGKLTVIIDTGIKRERLSEKQAQDYLESVLPMDFMPFFFFDGEKISFLAQSSERSREKQIEKLLGLHKFDLIIDTLKKIANEKKKHFTSDETRERFDQINLEITKTKRKQSDSKNKHAFLKHELEDLNNDLAKTKRDLETLTQTTSKNTTIDYSSKKETLVEKLQNANDTICQLMSELPLLTNRNLTERALTELTSITLSDNASQIDLLKELKEEIPSRVFVFSPHSEVPLTLDQKNFYNNKLERALNEKLEGFSELNKSLINIPQSIARITSTQLAIFLEDKHKRKQLTEALTTAHEAPIKIKEIENELVYNTTTQNPQAKDEKIKALHEKLSTLSREIGKKETELESFKTEYNSKALTDRINKLQKESDTLREEITFSDNAEKAWHKAKSLQRSFSNLKNQYKKEASTRLNDVINQKFQCIMTSHKQIAKIILKPENFTWELFDREGAIIGGASISSGMKQLIATSLVWTLQQLAGRNYPLVIDTPLARIDRGNQEALLKEYYPKASQQVIILPTDSELNLSKFNIIKDNIYKTITLKNTNGTNTELSYTSPFIEPEE